MSDPLAAPSSAQAGPVLTIGLVQAKEHYLNVRWPEPTRPNNRTYKNACTRLNAFAQSVKDARCEELTLESAAALIQRFMDERLKAGLSACSIDNDRRAISAFFAWLIRARMVSFRMNPASTELVRGPRVIKRCKRPLTYDELKLLLEATVNTVIYPFIVLIVGCGLRRVGASRVHREHIDLPGRTLIVFEKGRERCVPLSAWVVNELSAYFERHEWVSLHPDTIGRYLANIRKKKNLPAHFKLQPVRRTWIRKLYESGVSPQLTASLAGNSVEVIQEYYVELATMNARPVVDMIDFGKVASKQQPTLF